MKEVLRKYRDSDYAQCEFLVNEAWGFDKIFLPEPLSDFAKCIYTKGSVLSSNFRAVIEVDGNVAGFIFGLNEHSKRPGKNLIFALKMLWRILFIKSEKPVDKNVFINAINIHEQRKSKLVKKGQSEIVLFVVDKKYQGRGYGKRLWSEFLDQFSGEEATSIVVETNKFGASSFYECLGFKHLGNFDSPLHEFATKDGQACIYEYRCK